MWSQLTTTGVPPDYKYQAMMRGILRGSGRRAVSYRGGEAGGLLHVNPSSSKQHKTTARMAPPSSRPHALTRI